MFYDRKKCGFYIQDIFSVSRKSGVYKNTRRDFAGLAFRLKGGSTFVCENERIEAPKGSITYIPKGVDFDIHSKEEEVIIFHLSVFGECYDKITSIKPVHSDIYEGFFKNAALEWEKRRPGYVNRCMAILYSLFEALEITEQEPKDKRSALIEKGVLYMNMYFDKKNITVGDIAKRCNISEVYFRKLFREEYGISPLKFINHLRIKRAKKLLETGYYRVGEAATLSGFDDMKYFSTVFKKSMGLAPTEYLEKCQQESEDMI